MSGHWSRLVLTSVLHNSWLQSAYSLTAPAPMRHRQWAIWVGALYGHHKCTHRDELKYKMKSLWSTQRSTFKEVDVNCHHDEVNASSLFLFETASNFSFFPSLPNLNKHSLPPHAQFSSQIPPLHQGQMLTPSCHKALCKLSPK